MTKDETLKLALDFVASISPAFICEATHHKKNERHADNEPCPHVKKQKQTYEAIKEALAQPEQEPVACISCGAASTRYVDEDTDFPGTYCDHCGPGGVPSQQEPDYKALYEKAVQQYNDLAALMEQPQQEPVAVVSGYYGGQCVILPIDPARIFNSNTALYTKDQL